MLIGTRLPPFAADIGFVEYARWLVDNGFGAVDTPRLTPQVFDACEDLDLVIGTSDCSIGILLSLRDKDRQEAMKSLKIRLNLMAKNSHGGNTWFVALTPTDPINGHANNFAIWKEVFPEVVKYCEKKNIVIAIEPWPGTYPYYSTLGTTPEEWRAMFKHISSPYFGLCYDPSHLIRLQIDHMRALREFAHKINHVHLKDVVTYPERRYLSGILPPILSPSHVHGEGYWRYCIPGAGGIKWDEVIAILCENEYDGVLSIELEDENYHETAELQKQGLLKAKACIEQFL